MAIGPDRRTMSRAQAANADIDVGLRNYMLGVYNYMCLGVALTGVLAYLISSNPALVQTVAGGPFKWVLFIGILALGWFSGKIIMTGNMVVAQGAFWLYASMWGALLAPMFLIYTDTSIARTFFITAGMFGATSLYGYTTKRDLAPMGKFLMMATIGILIALLVNMFLLESSGFHFILSIVIVLVFAGLTAYETQAIKEAYYEGDDQELQTRKSIMGAFMLYGSFITMFVWLLQLFGVMEE